MKNVFFFLIHRYFVKISLNVDFEANILLCIVFNEKILMLIQDYLIKQRIKL